MRFNLQNFQSLKRIKFEVEMQLGGIVMCIFDLTKYLKLSENAIRKIEAFLLATSYVLKIHKKWSKVVLITAALKPRYSILEGIVLCVAQKNSCRTTFSRALVGILKLGGPNQEFFPIFRFLKNCLYEPKKILCALKSGVL